MRERLRFVYETRESDIRADIQREAKDIHASHSFYPVNQPPIYIALGSANTWPAGGLRRVDIEDLRCQFLADDSSDSTSFCRRRRSDDVPLMTEDPAQTRKDVGPEACKEMVRRRNILDRPHYDWATHDLFPAFRFDFRPAAETLEEIAKGGVSDNICSSNDPEPVGNLRLFASFLRNFPFMNTDVEQTRTIGNFIPLRSPLSTVRSGGVLPSTVYGTTHELSFNLGTVEADFMLPSYRQASDLAYT